VLNFSADSHNLLMQPDMTDASLWHEAACYAVTVYQTSTGGFEQQYCAAEAVVVPSGSPN